MEKDLPEQEQDLIFALDIGTRSVIGVVGRAEGERFRVLAIEKEAHTKRAMLDGQIEDIAQVAKVISTVTGRLEEKVGRRLRAVCIAAAGRALHTERGRFELQLPSPRRVDDELIRQLEAGAVSDAEGSLLSRGGEQGQFFLVGYTVSQYLLDRYPLSTLLDHNGRQLEAEIVATFLPGEVVESLYSAMRLAGLEVASLTLEPIAAINAAIPADLRLLNLVLADIGAGTSDVAACRDGSVVGYTMATMAGDEITEALMRAYLVDFNTAERLKTCLDRTDAVTFTDILGLEQQVDAEVLRATAEPPAQALAGELARRILEVNGGSAPSALFLAGGGSKLKSLCALMAEALEMDPRRVAVAGGNFHLCAVSQDYDLNDPEYATPLGIAVSAGLGLINDSYRVTLNGESAKLFRSGTLTALDVLMMNGYGYTDLIGRTGQSLAVTVDGKRRVYRGESATPSALRVNGEEVPSSTVIRTGDNIEFIPARAGRSVVMTLDEVLEGAPCEALVNGAAAPRERLMRSGDEVITLPAVFPAAPVAPAVPPAAPTAPQARRIILNGRALELPVKTDGAPYYLMDMLDRAGLDFERLERPVTLEVNGVAGRFTQILKDGDEVSIYPEETH